MVLDLENPASPLFPSTVFQSYRVSQRSSRLADALWQRRGMAKKIKSTSDTIGGYSD
jgi:hypothetical protein